MTNPNPAETTSMAWLFFALLVVLNWGLYGIFLHKGQMAMHTAGGPPPGDVRYKAFFFVGIAYLVIAVVGSAIMIKSSGGSFTFSPKGMSWSLIAGGVGAIGAFCVLLAFGAAPKPTYVYVPVVMSIIFAGAPIVNATVSMAMHPPQAGWASIPWQFFVGIFLAAAGGCLVTLFKPG
jgi:hypothetical protein